MNLADQAAIELVKTETYEDVEWCFGIGRHKDYSKMAPEEAARLVSENNRTCFHCKFFSDCRLQSNNNILATLLEFQQAAFQQAQQRIAAAPVVVPKGFRRYQGR